MTTALLIAILLAIAAIAVLIIYLIDRVNSIDKFARLVQADQSWSSSDPAAMGLFGDLHGKRLWDAVSGIPIEGWDKGAIDLIRNRYQLVLRRHIEDLFNEGLQHGREKRQGYQLSASRQISTLRGPVESWIPIENAVSIYNAGYARANAKDTELAQLRTNLDIAIDSLFSQASIKLARPMSASLIPGGENTTGDTPLDVDAATMAQAAAGAVPPSGLSPTADGTAGPQATPAASTAATGAATGPDPAANAGPGKPGAKSDGAPGPAAVPALEAPTPPVTATRTAAAAPATTPAAAPANAPAPAPAAAVSASAIAAQAMGLGSSAPKPPPSLSEMMGSGRRS
jgi:hypothetical protein